MFFPWLFPKIDKLNEFCTIGSIIISKTNIFLSKSLNSMIISCNVCLLYYLRLFTSAMESKRSKQGKEMKLNKEASSLQVTGDIDQLSGGIHVPI